MQESNRIELKRELTDTLEKEVIAFLNYRDGGDDQATDQVTGQVTGQAEALLKFCVIPRSTKEMMQYLGLSHRENFRDALLLPLIASGKLKLTIPDKPKSPNQRYIAVKPEVSKQHE